MNISLIMPFRGRTHKLRDMLISIERTTNNLLDVELILALDFDECLYNFAFPLDVKFYVIHRSEFFIRDYWNPISRLATGRWIMAINDDAVFETSGWDTIINERMSKAADDMKDDIFYGITDDGEKDKQDDYSCWCLLSRQHLQCMDFYDERCKVWGPDQVNARVYHRLSRMMKQKRCIDLKDVKITHAYDGFNKERMSRINNDAPYVTNRKDEEDKAYQLRKFIDRIHQCQ